jgi:hypothetical protein
MTQKRQADSAARKAAEAQLAAEREVAEKWRELESDPALRQHILNYYNGTATNQPEVPVVRDDLFALEPEGFVAELKKLIAPTMQQPALDVDAIEQRILAKQQAPLIHATALAEAAEEFGMANGMTPEIIAAASREMTKDHGGAANLTPELVTALLPRYAAFVGHEFKSKAAAREAQSTQKIGEQARAASPRGGDGVSVPGGQTFEQAIAAHQERTGRQVDNAEAAKIAYRLMMEKASTTTGKPRSELEAELSKDPWAFGSKRS